LSGERWLAGAEPQSKSALTPTAISAAREPFTVDVMRAAVRAIREGRFDVPATPIGAPSSPAHPALSHGRHDHVDGRSVVAVFAAHAGAGASTVALALSEALTGQASVELHDWNSPHRSALAPAVTQELGVESGWRQGRRGPLFIRCQAEAEVGHPPSAQSGRSYQVCVLDLGHLSDDALRAPVLATAAVVVVTRLSVPGFRQTEHVLSLLTQQALVVVIGPRRWPGSVEVSCGPRLLELKKMHRVIAMPTKRGLAVSGLTTDPLPRPVAAAGRRIADLLQPPPPATLPRNAATPTPRTEAS
jgi:hypothetical protein